MRSSRSVMSASSGGAPPRAAAARPDRREHPFSGGPLHLPQGGDQSLFLVREIVSDPSLR